MAANGKADLYEGKLFGLGNPLLDISTEVGPEFLEKYGMKANDAILGSEKQKDLCKDMIETYHHVDYVPGGACLNALRVCQWLLEKPHVAHFVGCIGKDKFGEIMLEKANSANVAMHCQVDEAQPTGSCAVLVSNGGMFRSLCAFLDASGHFNEKHFEDETTKALLAKATYYYVTGFFVNVSLECAMRCVKAGLAPGRIVCMNLSAPFICEFFGDRLDKLLPYVDILFGNEAEFEMFAKMHDFGTTDLSEIARLTAQLPYAKSEINGHRTVVISNGGNPCVVSRNAQIKLYPALKLEKVVDTNGAGDAFVGGFLSQLVKGEHFDTAIKCGHYAASVIIGRHGCTFPDEHNFQV